MIHQIKSIGTLAWVICFLIMPINISVFELKQSFILGMWSGIFNVDSNAIYSDSQWFWLTLLFSLLISILISIFVVKLFNAERLESAGIKVFDLIIFIVFMSYGLDKIQMIQFPVPEGNLLYSNLIEFDSDILFWTTAGSSTTFNYLTGGLELFGAGLLLIPRLNLLGRVILIGSALTIVGLNFSFDIGVKALSLFILLGLIIRSLPSITFLLQYMTQFQEDGNKINPRASLVFGLSAVICFGLYSFQGNQEIKDNNHESAAYESIDGVEKLFITADGYWIEKIHGKIKRSVSYELLNKETYRVHFETGTRVFLIEEYENYVSIKNLNYNSIETYKKLDLSPPQSTWSWTK